MGPNCVIGFRHLEHTVLVRSSPGFINDQHGRPGRVSYHSLFSARNANTRVSSTCLPLAPIGSQVRNRESLRTHGDSSTLRQRRSGKVTLTAITLLERWGTFL
jgi:hypothetical protein